MTDQTAPREVEHYLKAQKELVDQQLSLFLPDPETYPSKIHLAMRYSLFAGGKRIRPILALATSESLGGEFQRVIYLACALEMIHTYSLIHDDLPAMDNDDYRRGRPTLHRQFGEGVAILAGNGLLTLAFQLLTEIPDGESVGHIRLDVIKAICQAIGPNDGMIAGQVVDLLTEGEEFSAAQLEYIHSAKTGALLHASVYCAALLSGADEEALNHLSRFARKIGLAFQVVDDILDVTGSDLEMGKKSGQDHLGEKATYPALYGLEESRRIVHELVHQATGELMFLGVRGERLRELARFISTRRF